MRLHQAVLFDLDGTLVDSLQGIAATLDAVLTQLDEAPCDPAALRSLVGAPLEQIFTHILSQRDIGVQDTPGAPPSGSRHTLPIDRCVQTYLSLYPSIGVPAAPLFPGIKDTLDACRDSGLRLAIVTSKRHFLAQEILRATHIGAYFDVVIGADATAHHKPHPAPALAALERLELPPRAATVVGDATYDMLMARAAGCGAVGVAWGYGEETALQHAGAEVIAGTPSELTTLLV